MSIGSKKAPLKCKVKSCKKEETPNTHLRTEALGCQRVTKWRRTEVRLSKSSVPALFNKFLFILLFRKLELVNSFGIFIGNHNMRWYK